MDELLFHTQSIFIFNLVNTTVDSKFLSKFQSITILSCTHFCQNLKICKPYSVNFKIFQSVKSLFSYTYIYRIFLNDIILLIIAPKNILKYLVCDELVGILYIFSGLLRLLQAPLRYACALLHL